MKYEDELVLVNRRGLPVGSESVNLTEFNFGIHSIELFRDGSWTPHILAKNYITLLQLQC